ncbi:MAG: cytochrome b N-terminal domain-containing protein [Candidatus Thiodiazotropha sp. (ex Ctena orbiculata)]|uniref:Cytochrome b n=1 Tax=Candidatus Thiodiazotropha taylori TaxID=2792791 RepID=A0A944MBR2_9GAMM|nr:cytochrome b N-terminal domain-containing protein [Candidatus Thiodiazotropha taylori]PUB85523.1 MAG: cytochrome b [gamma proteobacterium symbiont of Ctena orbiculata]MBT2990944.1 cytochrome b N-terminal domain-containing protein [Candidatus Thiodiazotropha taylori]MBT2998675.1 cytochrome b N-terminal domain-containing protein [Candidatus Thiodiazotropha taylori]MBT3002789.1 cytochrome b N-terminal domain-containing protein [Candidatus Thiodiazotropha taylori]
MSMMKNFMGWIDDRYPMTKVWNEHLAQYYAPKNFNFWYFMGSLALLVLVIQIVTGVWLAMSYKPDAELAFGSVEYIMRDVEWGWLIRYLHSTGASAFFVVIYLHMFRGLMYGSYRKPRELLWIIGVIIYLAMMATAFFGYLLPWGQMSYWGAQVIVNLFSAVPVIGPDLGVWVRGDYVISDATLNRFFALHFLLPFILAALVFIHIVALHKVGSNNPDGIEIKKGPKGNRWSDTAPADGIPFHPYYTVKDIAGVAGFLFLFAAVVFFAPEMGGYFIEHPNFEPANPLKTPEHIAPVWYFTPFYAILRAVPSIAGSAFPGVVAMFASILIMFFLPWLDRSPVKSIKYKGMLYKVILWLFVLDFIMLGYLGVKPTTDLYKLMAQIGTIYYFAFFLLMPIYSKIDKTKPVPERVTE